MSNKELAVTSHDQFIKAVQIRISDLQKTRSIQFPPKYNPDNALISAGLMLQGVKDKNGKPALEVCTKESITSALVNMTVQGLSVAKNQGYFIVYGNKLIFMRSYFGTEASAKRACPDIQEVKPVVVYENDTFKYHVENGKNVIDKHETSFANMDNDFIGAYCIVEMEGDKPNYIEIMTKKMIKVAWSKGMPNSKFQREFPDQAVKRTIVNRACKVLINTSDDSSLDVAVQAFNASGDAAFEDVIETEDNKQIETKHGKVEMEVQVEEKKESEKPKVEKKTERVVVREPAKEKEEVKKEEPERSELDIAKEKLIDKINKESSKLSEDTVKIIKANIVAANDMDACFLIDHKIMVLTYLSDLESNLIVAPDDVGEILVRIIEAEDEVNVKNIFDTLKKLNK